LSELAELGLKDADTSESERKNKLRGIAERINDVYSDREFRYRHSEIIDVIHRYASDQNLSPEKRLDKANERGAFLQFALKELLVHECDDTCTVGCPIKELGREERFEQLYDHVRLEAKRTGYDYGRATSILDQLNKAQSDLDEARGELSEAKTRAKRASKQAKRLQTETVSVLGVFSAIILAFNASVTFTTSSIAAVNTTPPFNVAFVVAIVGFMVFNCLYAAFAFVYRIVRPGKSPDRFISPRRAAGIELSALSCALMLGTLSFTYGMAIWPTTARLSLGASLVCNARELGVLRVPTGGPSRGGSGRRGPCRGSRIAAASS
jgi:hypothetical protein